MWVSKMQYDVMQIKKKATQTDQDLKQLTSTITTMQKEIMQVLTDIRIALERKVDRHD
jgi:peptidoglycan hydrolase CwlO-like protein